MSGKKVIAICFSGGEFVETDTDGQLEYKGGDAHAIEIDEKMKFRVLKVEVADMFNSNVGSMCMKYFLPDNKKPLINIANDKDLKRMLKYYEDADTVEIYVMPEEIVAPAASNMPGSRSSRTTLSEAEVPVNNVSPTAVNTILDDINEPSYEARLDVSDEMPMPMPVAYIDPYSKALEPWQNDITGVGQRFRTVHDFREALRKYAIANRFGFVYKKNESSRVTVKCKVEGCPWRIHASRLTTTPLFCIKKMTPTHTCEGAGGSSGHKATRSWIASIVKEKLKLFPEYKPKDIVDDIKQEYGIQLNYCQAWRGKEIAKEQLQGSFKEAYKQLPFFCEKILETNPGSFATFATKEDSSFHRLFVSFHASLYGFKQGCRPLLFLDNMFLKSKYEGTLLAATAVDGDDGVFPLAFAIVDRESSDNWHWFLQQLKNALSVCHGLTFVADREKGLKESINNIYRNEEVFHGFSLHYLSKQLIRDLKGQFSNEAKGLLVEDFYGAAHAPTPEGFHRCAERIKHLAPEAYNWIMKSEPEHWANAYFRGARYDNMSSNFGEFFYSWVSDAHELPITQMVDVIRNKITELMFARRTEANLWLRRLTPSMEERLDKERLKCPSLAVLMATGNRFEVRGDTIEQVDVESCACSCKVWQLTGLPCCHAIAVITCLGRDPYDYCSRYFTTESYKVTYSESVNPITTLDVSFFRKGADGFGAGSELGVTVTPPTTRRPPGRPAKGDGSNVRKRRPKCSRCKEIGHKKAFCKALL